MTTENDVITAVRSYADGRVEAAVGPLEAQVAGVTAERDQLKSSLATVTAERDKAKTDYAEHLKLPAPAGHLAVPEPTPHTVLLGGSYSGPVDAQGNSTGGADESLYLGRAKVARSFNVGNLPTDVRTSPGWKQAYNEGVRTFILSWKGTQSGATIANCLKSIPADCTVYGSYFHEPEDNIADKSLTLADWKARSKEHNAAMRTVGVTPVTILMAWTLNAKSGRNVMDYAGVGAEGILFDCYFNEAEGKVNPEEQVAKMAEACKAMGLKFTGTAETGVNMNGTGKALAIDLTRRMRTALFAEPLAALGTWWSTNEFAFIPETADAWFLGK